MHVILSWCKSYSYTLTYMSCCLVTCLIGPIVPPANPMNIFGCSSSFYKVRTIKLKTVHVLLTIPAAAVNLIPFEFQIMLLQVVEWKEGFLLQPSSPIPLLGHSSQKLDQQKKAHLWEIKFQVDEQDSKVRIPILQYMSNFISHILITKVWE